MPAHYGDNPTDPDYIKKKYPKGTPTTPKRKGGPWRSKPIPLPPPPNKPRPILGGGLRPPPGRPRPIGLPMPPNLGGGIPNLTPPGGVTGMPAGGMEYGIEPWYGGPHPPRWEPGDGQPGSGPGGPLGTLPDWPGGGVTGMPQDNGPGGGPPPDFWKQLMDQWGGGFGGPMYGGGQGVDVGEMDPNGGGPWRPPQAPNLPPWMGGPPGGYGPQGPNGGDVVGMPFGGGGGPQGPPGSWPPRGGGVMGMPAGMPGGHQRAYIGPYLQNPNWHPPADTGPGDPNYG